MANPEKKPADGEAQSDASVASPPQSKAPRKGVVLGGGIVGLVGLAWALSLVAVPSRGGEPEHAHRLGGPYLADISPSAGFQVNLSGDGGKHYLSLKLNVEVDAFDQSYATARASDPLYQAKLTDAVLRTASQKTKGELDSQVGREVFREELRVALDPVLFPVHVGDEHSAEAGHAASGLRFGRSIAKSSLRGFFHEHWIHLDAAKKKIRLDDGKELVFRGDETDLWLEDSRGKGVYVDVSAVHPDFDDRVSVGTFGRVRNVYFNTFLTQ